MNKMQILSIKSSRFPQRVYLKISNGLFLAFFIDDLVALSLHSGQEISDDDLIKIINLSLAYLLKDYSLRQIAISPKSEAKLAFKLKAYLNRCLKKYNLFDYSPDLSNLIHNCLSWLKSKSLLDLDDYVQYFLKKHKNKSAREISYLLSQEGIKIDSSAIGLSSETDKIKAILAKKRFDLSKICDPKSKNKIFSYLYRHGFSLSDIKTAIDEMTNSR